VAKHRYFNTNNLWVDLAKLKAKMAQHEGVLPLPVMKNRKTVDPRDKESTPVRIEYRGGGGRLWFRGTRSRRP
jgi:UDP-N-acetylglucosamine pyrophosphorylase